MGAILAAPLDVIIVGDSLNTRGFESFNTISGLGLVTMGFLWDCGNIWAPNDPSVTTTWTVYNEPNTTVTTCTDIY